MARTTIALDDDIMRFANDYARQRSISLGKAVSELVRRGIRHAPMVRMVNGLAVFDLPEDSPPVTAEDVARAAAEEL